jgi:hypothetical protein
MWQVWKIYGLIFGVQQIANFFWFLGILFSEVGVVCLLCGCCFILFLQATCTVMGIILKKTILNSP